MPIPKADRRFSSMCAIGKSLALNKQPVHIDFPGLIGDGMPNGQMAGTYPGIGVMGDLVEAVAEFTRDEIVSPLPNANSTLNLGMRHSPEGACLPFKLIAGSLMESIDRGANLVGMITERGPCRLGTYSLGLRLLLKEAGLEGGWVDFDNTNVRAGYIRRFKEMYFQKYDRRLSWFDMGRGFVMGFLRLAYIEALEAERNCRLAIQRRPGDVETCFQEGAEKIRAARTPWSMRWALGKARAAMRAIPLDRKRPTVQVVITGEVYCVIDPFANGRLEQRLAQLGAEPCRVLWQTDYLLHGMGLGRLGHLGGRPAAIRAARPYMADNIGGDAAANVGHAVLAKRRGMHGLVHLKPFACMMEFISENVLQKVSEELDFPVLSLTLDDVNGAERIHVRLEAFVENLFRRCATRKSRSGDAFGKRP